MFAAGISRLYDVSDRFVTELVVAAPMVNTSVAALFGGELGMFFDPVLI